MIRKQHFKTRKEWEEYRNSRFWVGGSNIGIILGLSDYCTPLEYWHKVKEGTEESGAALSRGRFMENGIAQWFEQESGAKIVKKTAGYLVFSNDKYLDYFQVAPDREVFAYGDRVRSGVEIKDTRRLVDFDDLSTIPQEWYAQIQYNMGIMERPYWWLVVCDGSKRLQFRKFAFDSAYFSQLIAQAGEWVEKYIIGDQMPPMTAKSDVLREFPQSEATEKPVTDEVAELCEALRAAQKRKKECENEIERLQNSIVSNFEANDTITYQGAAIATFKTQTKKNVDMALLLADMGEEANKYIKITSYRTFRLK